MISLFCINRILIPKYKLKMNIIPLTAKSIIEKNPKPLSKVKGYFSFLLLAFLAQLFSMPASYPSPIILEFQQSHFFHSYIDWKLLDRLLAGGRSSALKQRRIGSG